MLAALGGVRSRPEMAQRQRVAASEAGRCSAVSRQTSPMGGAFGRVGREGVGEARHHDDRGVLGRAEGGGAALECEDVRAAGAVRGEREVGASGEEGRVGGAGAEDIDG